MFWGHKWAVRQAVYAEVMKTDAIVWLRCWHNYNYVQMAGLRRITTYHACFNLPYSNNYSLSNCVNLFIYLFLGGGSKFTVFVILYFVLTWLCYVWGHKLSCTASSLRCGIEQLCGQGVDITTFMYRLRRTEMPRIYHTTWQMAVSLGSKQPN